MIWRTQCRHYTGHSLRRVARAAVGEYPPRGSGEHHDADVGHSSPAPAIVANTKAVYVQRASEYFRLREAKMAGLGTEVV